MKIQRSVRTLACSWVVAMSSYGTTDAEELGLADVPLFMVSVKPSIMVMMDNSGSMKMPMYPGDFNTSKSYYGIFDSTKNYAYDDSIPVNSSAYSVNVDDTMTGAFVESDCSFPADASFCWNGNFLNWLSTRRIDATRMVMVGGKPESDSSYNYSSGYKYKIVGNNEFEDDDINRNYAESAAVSPVPNGTGIRVYSPAQDTGGTIQDVYDPYAKIAAAGVGEFGTIYNVLGDEVGEFGTASISAILNSDGDLTSWLRVNFTNTYSSTPVVVAKPPTYAGTNDALVRIRSVDTTGFEITIQEWDHEDGPHVYENISYVVMKPGEYALPDGMDVKVGTVDVDWEYVSGDCGTLRDIGMTKNYASNFSEPSVVITSVMSFTDPEPVTSRVWDVTTSGFKVALQEALQPTTPGHSTETVSYIAFAQGEVVDENHNWFLEVGAVSEVTDDPQSWSFNTAKNSTPAFLADIQTMAEQETAALRLISLYKSYFSLHVEEEESCDTDVTHQAETVGYAAFSGGKGLNLALAVKDKPEGLLQEIAPDVRLGVSFYRYNPNANDIYNDNLIDGGTLRFKIPINPFVKKPSDEALGDQKGYRELDGYIDNATDNIDDIVDAINHYPLVWGTSPIAENLWEVIRYFGQESPAYDDVITGFSDFDLADESNPERDPFYYPEYSSKLFCISPSVVIFTDGEPSKDAAIPSEIVDYDDDDQQGDLSSTDPDDMGADNLDDVAYWAFCNKSDGACTTDDGTRDLRDALAGDQYLTVYTVGFANNNITQILQDTADNAGGEAYAAADGLQLKESLKKVFSAAMSRSSASSVALNTGSITSSSMLFQAVFESTDWSGDIEAYDVDDTDGTVADSTTWKASDNLPGYAERHLITHNGNEGVPFQWSSPGISDAQKALLGSEDVLTYLRGDSSNEESFGGTFRDRDNKLGDFINSTPVWVGAPGMHYPDIWEDGATENSYPYSTYKSSSQDRIAMVYAGANDGMMHAFRVSDGVELFAYIPGKLFSKLPELAEPDYVHQYYTDGSATIMDAFFDGAWHTVLVAGLNNGSQAVYALDVSYPSAYAVDEETAAEKVLWEFDDAVDSLDDADGYSNLGYTFSQPNVVRLPNGKWAVIFGNGYNNTESDGYVSATGNAVLYILDIATGEVLERLDTGVGADDDPLGLGRPNGFASISPIDITGDMVADIVYAGDLFGNLWKFDLDSMTIAFRGDPLFTACEGTICDSSNVQPITTRPQIGYHPSKAGYMVYFGTGKYIEYADDTNLGQVTQSFYGIWDDPEDATPTVTRSELLQQEITHEVDIDSDGMDDYRISTDNPVDWHTHKGWYLNLVNTEEVPPDNKGERQITSSILREGRIIFTTLLPQDDPCSAGGSGWLMELDAADGSRLEFSPFDINNDGKFDENDYVQSAEDINEDGEVNQYDRLPTSGVKSKVGIIPMPTILANQREGREYKYTPGTTGEIQKTTENPGYGARGRQSWSELGCQ